jgi:hypothetical protein
LKIGWRGFRGSVADIAEDYSVLETRRVVFAEELESVEVVCMDKR